jgi:dCTP diphosphatase
MADRSVSEALESFVAARDWDQFHSPENLAKSIVIEAAELLECFQWGAQPDELKVKEELADVLTYCYLLAAKLDLNPDQIIMDKLKVTEVKYSVEKSRGRSTKYDQLPD